MFRKVAVTFLLLSMTAGTGTVARIATVPASAQTSGASHTAPGSPVSAPVVAANSAPAQLTVAQMSEIKGDGWLKKIWNKIKKFIKKIVEIIVQEIIDEIFSETMEQVTGIDGVVTETYQSTETTELVYASESDYNSNVVSGSSYSDSGWDQTAYQYNPEY
jgi:hypothetical protein